MRSASSTPISPPPASTGAQVDTVILSHFHGDHINGLLTADSKAAFPNAEIMVPATEWKYWSDDGEMSKAAAGSPLEGNFKNIRRVFGALGNKVDAVRRRQGGRSGHQRDGDAGHTPGHTSYIVASGDGQRAGAGRCHRGRRVVVRRATRMACRVRYGWCHGGGDPPQDSTTWRAAERLLIQGFHFPFPALGYVEKDGAGYRLVPASWNPVL